MGYDPWVCRCGHEFAIENAGTRHARQVPHECLRTRQAAGKMCETCYAPMPSFRVNPLCEECYASERPTEEEGRCE